MTKNLQMTSVSKKKENTTIAIVNERSSAGDNSMQSADKVTKIFFSFSINKVYVTKP